MGFRTLALVILSAGVAGAASFVTGAESASVGEVPKASSSSTEMGRISPAEVKTLMDEGADITLVDTRMENAYKKGHIAGAVNLPWKETIGEPVDLPRNRLLILYCDCTDEATSLDVARQLIHEWGYRNVKVLKSGLDGWIRLGYPLQGQQREGIRCN